MKSSQLKALTFYIFWCLGLFETLASECDRFGVCSQHCHVVAEKARCSCADGFELKGNSSCVPSDPAFKLLYENPNGIFSMTSSVYKTTIITNSVGRNTAGFTVDIRNNIMYWTDSQDQRPAVRKISLGNDGTPELVVDVGLYTPDKIAFDWITGSLYFVDYHKRHIAVCALNPTRCTVVFKGQEGNMMGTIALHPNQGIMFWTEHGNTTEIMKSKMDGSSSTSIASITSLVSGIALDEANSRLYWVDVDQKKIESARLDGSDRRVITTEKEFPLAIDIFGDQVYWSEYIDHNIMIADKFTGKVDTMQSTTSSSMITGLFVMNIGKQPKQRPNPCKNLKCSYFCVLSGPGAECLCPVGMVNNGSTCIDDEKQPKLLFAQGRILLVMPMNAVGKDVFKEIALPSEIQVIIALVYNPINNSVIIYDNESQKIYAFHLSNNETRVLVENDLRNVTAMDIDLVGENLVWIDIGKKTIEVLSLRTRHRSVVRRNMENTEDILFSSHLGLLYISKLGEKLSGEIYQMYLGNSDSNAKLICNDSSLLQPVVMGYDQEKGGVVLWDKTGFADIFQSPEGTPLRKLYTFPQRYKQDEASVSSIVKIQNTIFWIDKHKNGIKVLSIDKVTNNFVIGLIETNENGISQSSATAKKVLAPMIQDIGYLDNRRKEHECSPSNPTRKVCAQICLSISSGNGGVCWCTQGYHLGKDGLSCIVERGSTRVVFIVGICVLAGVALLIIAVGFLVIFKRNYRPPPMLLEAHYSNKE